MDDKIGLTSNFGEDTMIDNFDSEMVLLYGMELNVEEPLVAIGIEDKAGHPKESEMVYRDEEKNENYIEEVGNDDDPREEVNIEDNMEEDPEEKVRNDENTKEEENVEENNDEDPEEEVRNDENNPGEDVKNEEDAMNYVRNEVKLEAISKKKVSKLRKRIRMLKKKKTALRTKVKNVHISTSKLDEDTEMISLPMIDENSTPNDAETREFASEKNSIFDSGVVLSNQRKMNVVALGDEIGEAVDEENSREESQNEGYPINEAKAKEKLEGNSKKKANKQRKIHKKKKKALGVKNEVVVNNKENPESSKRQVTIKEKCKGMIFMCSSKTKKDCYHYQVLGLPASKRDIVFEIYEGMKLFLFDFDLKLMYGIYEAAGPGGYNIEPKAFKSAFPSQVRFSVLEDCLPLAEEKFKKIIKDNYYSKIKFDCQLNSKQVEGLCELFRVVSKGSTFKQLHGSQRVEASAFVDYGPKQPSRGSKAEKPRRVAPAFVNHVSKRPHRCMKAESQQVEAPRPADRGRKWPRKNRKAESLQAKVPKPVDREPKQPYKNRKAESSRGEPPAFVDRKYKQPRRSRKAETHQFADHKPKRLRRSPRAETQNLLYGDSRHHGWEDERHHTLARDQLYPEDPVAYRRAVYESPLEHPLSRQPLHRPLASSLPFSERDVYWRDQLQYHDLRPLDVGVRRRDEFEHLDSYAIPRYQDDFDHRGSYLASRGYLSYHDPSSSAAQSSKHYTPAYRTPASTYHLSAASPPDYQHHRTAYGYYP